MTDGPQQPRRKRGHGLSRRTFLKGVGVAAAVPWLGATSGSAAPVSTADTGLKLWYSQPAKEWVEALPIGNGRLGAMVFGGVTDEHLQFNEETLWTGQPHEYQHEGAVKFLPTIRRLLFEGKQKEAEDLAMKEFMSVPLRQKTYQAFGDVHLLFPGHTDAINYRRELDLDSAVARVSYQSDGVTYERQAFSSHPDNVIVWHVTASKPGRVSFTAKIDSLHASARTAIRGKDQLALFGQVEEGGVQFEARLSILAPGGKIKTTGDGIVVENADSATLTLAAATSFKNYHDISGNPATHCETTMKNVAGKNFAALIKAHVTDHQRLFRRVALDLGTTPAADLPTDERLKNESKETDPQLAALYFQYGRYLLIASSRPGSQPANLQGIWNDSLKPSWGSKWTVNINTEMNYWPAEACNLSECHEPLFDMIEDCSVSGRKTAEAHYGARGWVLHHNTDIWRGTAPINASNHGTWVTGGAWLCHHLSEHYLFTGDLKFLKTRGYPMMKEAAVFFTDYLVKDPKTGLLISGPSNSPEHGGMVMGPTMDHQIIRDLFANTAAAARTLGVDKDLAEKLDRMRNQIAPNKIGQHGQLQEWLEDKDDPKDTHRHASHLWALFPGSEISPQRPDMFKAAKQSLIFRGDGGTGWSLAWKINFWARLLDGDHAYKMLSTQLRPPGSKTENLDSAGGGTYPNLFDAHPPFQIDGNFGGTSGITEMLVQSHTGVIQLLPALPKAWPNGSVTGLRTRGGFELDMTWKNGKFATARLRSLLGNPCKLQIGTNTVEFPTKRGKSYSFRGLKQLS